MIVRVRDMCCMKECLSFDLYVGYMYLIRTPIQIQSMGVVELCIQARPAAFGDASPDRK